VLWAVWIALAFLLIVLGVGGWHVVREGLAFWRTLKAFTALIGRAGDVLAQRADEVSRKAAGAGDRVERLAAATERLSRSVAYARIVLGAAVTARAAFAAARGWVPRK
jgi:hypothetical protein